LQKKKPLLNARVQPVPPRQLLTKLPLTRRQPQNVLQLKKPEPLQLRRLPT
jgi:hypothetical protein